MRSAVLMRLHPRTHHVALHARTSTYTHLQVRHGGGAQRLVVCRAVLRRQQFHGGAQPTLPLLVLTTAPHAAGAIQEQGVLVA
jgi:hypothetical protein